MSFLDNIQNKLSRAAQNVQNKFNYIANNIQHKVDHVVQNVKNKFSSNGGENNSSNVTTFGNGNISSDNVIIVNGKVISGGGQSSNHNERGNHQITTSNRSLPAYNKIHVEGAIEARFNPSGAPSAKVTADSSLQNKIQTEVRDGVLYVRPVASYHSKTPIHVDIAGPQISGVHLSGASTFKASNMNTPMLTLDISGASRIDLNGSVQVLNVMSNGASTVNASNLKAEAVALDVSGASTVNVHAKQSVSGEVSGASNVNVHGNPKNSSMDVSGASEVHQASLPLNTNHAAFMAATFNEVAGVGASARSGPKV
jgi:Putative auto-transporter adhesin, head GIN domain